MYFQFSLFKNYLPPTFINQNFSQLLTTSLGAFNDTTYLRSKHCRPESTNAQSYHFESCVRRGQNRIQNQISIVGKGRK